MRLAACYLSDIAWSEHPDYRADIAFLRVLRMPLTGIDHVGRAFLALSVFTRYDGAAEGEVTRPAWLLLGEDELREAYLLGLGLRLAYTLSGGTALLRRVQLKADHGTLRLIVPVAAPFPDRRGGGATPRFDRPRARPQGGHQGGGLGSGRLQVRRGLGLDLQAA